MSAADFSDVQVAETFLHHRVLILPVVRQGHVFGVITRGDFFQAPWPSASSTPPDPVRPLNRRTSRGHQLGRARGGPVALPLERHDLGAGERLRVGRRRAPRPLRALRAHEHQHRQGEPRELGGGQAVGGLGLELADHGRDDLEPRLPDGRPAHRVDLRLRVPAHVGEEVGDRAVAVAGRDPRAEALQPIVRRRAPLPSAARRARAAPGPPPAAPRRPPPGRRRSARRGSRRGRARAARASTSCTSSSIAYGPWPSGVSPRPRRSTASTAKRSSSSGTRRSKAQRAEPAPWIMRSGARTRPQPHPPSAHAGPAREPTRRRSRSRAAPEPPSRARARRARRKSA